MIQLNLLPDVKLQYIKTRRNRRFIIVTASLVSSIALGIFGLLVVITDVYQGKKIEDLDTEISSQVSELRSDNELGAILTVQDQLDVLTGLHDNKTATTRLFGYLQKIIPANVAITSLELDFVANTISISGTADDVFLVNKTIETLNYAQYDLNAKNPEADPAAKELKNAFSNVTLDGQSNSRDEVTYQISGLFKPEIFANTAPFVDLFVPNQVTTRSITEQPGSLFEFKPEINSTGVVE